MKQAIRRLTITVGALGALVVPALAGAQQPQPRGAGAAGSRVGMQRDLPSADATRILNLRRVLDLTPRQVTQLDSIERVQVAARRATGEQLRARRDSMGAQGPQRAQRAQRAQGAQMRQGMMRDSAGRAAMRDSMRDSMQARMQAMRPQMEEARRRDSVGRAAAERVLNDTQRQQLRELQAEERGRQRGLREARVGGRQGPRRPMR